MALSPTRESLYMLINDLPDSQLPEAERLLQVLHLKATTPIDDEPLTEDDREAILEARSDINRANTISHEEAMRQLLGDR